ncbi:hypothetical protein HYC85_024470 [Camellia sinensis]|uniref:Uncharacterized protein n=1 Tax=Camellia sinensis TaxID=4442 RepID=A0A7J7GC21_CAMSI|nr:hypothetical protein HYC85_024470 [Camellia sinensis]
MSSLTPYLSSPFPHPLSTPATFHATIPYLYLPPFHPSPYLSSLFHDYCHHDTLTLFLDQ